MTDPLRASIHELYDSELAHLLATYRLLAFGASRGTQRAFYLSVAAHLNVEKIRRSKRWSSLWAQLLDDGDAGEIVTDMAAHLEESHRQLREGDK